jgi:hypothetical protein
VGPPFIFVLLIFLFFGAVFAAIGLLIMLVITKALKVKIGAKRILTIPATFLVLFFASTLVSRETRNGVTVTFFGPDEPTYVGEEITYGVPFAWISVFNTYDNATRPLSLIPYGFYIQAFLIDFVFWIVISAVIVNAIVIIRNRKRNHKE